MYEAKFMEKMIETKYQINQRRTLNRLVLSLLASLSLISVIAFIWIIIFVFLESVPILENFTAVIDFFTSDVWEPSTLEFGAQGMFYSSFFISLLSLIMAIPIGVASAIFLSLYAPYRLRSILRPIIEVIAAFPSVILGLFAATFMTIFIRDFFNIGSGRVIFTASIVLVVMILPLIISLTMDALESVPQSLVDASVSLGATKFETIKTVLLPYSKSAIIAAVILSFGRVFGETMVVLMLGGNSPSLPAILGDPFAAFYAMPAAIALEIQNAAIGGAEYHSLFTIGFFLLIISFLVITLASIITKSPRRSSLFLKIVFFPILIINRLLKEGWYFLKKTVKGKNQRTKVTKQPLDWMFKGKDLNQNINSSLKNRYAFDILTNFLTGFIVSSFLLVVLSISAFIISNGINALNPSFLFTSGQKVTYYDPATGFTEVEFGIFNAIIGSFIVVIVATIISIVIATSTALYLTEIAHPESRIALWVRRSLASLSAVPSIVIGLFGFGIFVVFFGWGQSILSLACTLMIMMLPISITSAIEAIEQVPEDYKNAGLALGATRWEVVRYQVLPNAIPGLITAYIFGIARVFGETAPVLLAGGVMTTRVAPTSLTNQGVAMLPLVVYVIAIFSTDPRAELWAFGAATVLLIMAFGLMVLGTIIRERYKRKFT